MSRRYRPKFAKGSCVEKCVQQEDAPRRGYMRPPIDGRTAKAFKQAQIRQKSRSIARRLQTNFAHDAPISEIELNALAVGLGDAIRFLFKKEIR